MPQGHLHHLGNEDQRIALVFELTPGQGHRLHGLVDGAGAHGLQFDNACIQNAFDNPLCHG